MPDAICSAAEFRRLASDETLLLLSATFLTAVCNDSTKALKCFAISPISSFEVASILRVKSPLEISLITVTVFLIGETIERLIIIPAIIIQHPMMRTLPKRETSIVIYVLSITLLSFPMKSIPAALPSAP